MVHCCCLAVFFFYNANIHLCTNAAFTVPMLGVFWLPGGTEQCKQIIFLSWLCFKFENILLRFFFLISFVGSSFSYKTKTGPCLLINNQQNLNTFTIILGREKDTEISTTEKLSFPVISSDGCGFSALK